MEQWHENPQQCHTSITVNHSLVSCSHDNHREHRTGGWQEVSWVSILDWLDGYGSLITIGAWVAKFNTVRSARMWEWHGQRDR
ncbi:hypothetical protein HPP92_029097 [Vanilla planifolia]|uniref:Uncharacterized protein n=1 Tax=Vanilla planifolia TaxID=51239 RepID=A0A835P3M0_VANPL|nr:hypothetical protein HPP92_029097 [Vanilla planifolia]KAG0445917.1 hypothetical protein HPP92_029086 [Vanilla planifolia]